MNTNKVSESFKSKAVLAGISAVAGVIIGLLMVAAVLISKIMPGTAAFTLFFIIIPGILMPVVVFAVKGMVIKNLQSILENYSKVAEGDLTARVEEGNGMFGVVAGLMNRTVDGMKKLVGSVTESADNILNLAENLSASTEEINASSEEISSTVQQIARGVEQQAERTVETSRIMENMSGSIQKVAHKAEEVLGVANAAKDASEKGEASVRQAMSKMDDIVKVTKESSKSISDLRGYSDKITEVVNIITEIADETNLLALNAAIEAARAGEAGRGFAVVADEVRKLAEGSASAAKEISGFVEEIQQKTVNVEKAADVAVRETEEGKRVASLSNNALNEITNVVEKVVGLAREIFELTKAQAVDTDKVVKAVEEIAAVAEETAAGTEQASASTEQQTASMEEIAAQAQELAQTASVLKDAINKFRV